MDHHLRSQAVLPGGFQYIFPARGTLPACPARREKIAVFIEGVPAQGQLVHHISMTRIPFRVCPAKKIRPTAGSAVTQRVKADHLHLFGSGGDFHTVCSGVPGYFAVKGLAKKAQRYQRPPVEDYRRHIQGNRRAVAKSSFVANSHLNQRSPVGSLHCLRRVIPANLDVQSLRHGTKRD